MRLRHAVMPALASIAMIAALASPAAAAGHGSKPRDTDHDGMSDKWEVVHHLNPRKAADARKDADNDGLTNLQEFRDNGDPRSADTDKDGVDDALEVRLHTKLNRADSDGDGIGDGDEDANHDGICDRDQREAVGTISSFDPATGDLVLTTKAGAEKTLTLTSDTEIEQREHRGWRHSPDGDPSTGPDDSGDGSGDVSDDPSDDSMDPSTDSGGTVFGDDDWTESDAGDMPSDGSDDDTSESADEVAPTNAELLTTGAVVLRAKVEDGVVTELKLA